MRQQKTARNIKEDLAMKQLLTLALAVLMCVFAISALADTVSIDRTLELQFVPSKDADVIITGTKNLPELERRGQQDPQERPAGHLLPLPDLRHAFRLRQGAGRQGQRGRGTHLG